MSPQTQHAGRLLRDWRERRRLSQLHLATEAEISQKHLSFVESGRSVPSRDMVLHLAEHLGIPLRDRNAILVAAGFAPAYEERRPDHPDLEAARRVIELILDRHDPNPALAIDRHWQLVSANRAATRMLSGVDASLLEPPVNVLRLSLHPGAFGSRLRNFREWRAHILARLARQIDNSADPELMELADELEGYPAPDKAKPLQPGALAAHGGIAVPMELDSDHGTLSFLSTTTIFGTALDIGLSELAIETFFPADDFTAGILRGLSESANG